MAPLVHATWRSFLPAICYNFQEVYVLAKNISILSRCLLEYFYLNFTVYDMPNSLNFTLFLPCMPGNSLLVEVSQYWKKKKGTHLHGITEVRRRLTFSGKTSNTQAVIFIYQLNNNSSNVSLFAKLVNSVK